MRLLTFIFLFLSFGIDLNAQGNLIARWDQKASIAKVDKLGQVYFVNGSRVEKFNKSGKLSDVYDRSDLGDISSIDLNDPFKPMLFFKDHATIVICDSKLQILSKIDLREYGIFQPIAACVSPSQGFWVIDQQNFKLKKFDTFLKPVIESEELSRYLSSGIRSNSLAERNDRVFLQTQAGRVIVFDRFANVLQQSQDSIPPVIAWTEREHYYIDVQTIMKINSASVMPIASEYAITDKKLVSADKSGDYLLLIFEEFIELREFKF